MEHQMFNLLGAGKGDLDDFDSGDDEDEGEEGDFDDNSGDEDEW